MRRGIHRTKMATLRARCGALAPGRASRKIRTVPGIRARPTRRCKRAATRQVRASAAGIDLSGPESVLQALGALAAVIAVHEMGHFTAARLQNIRVSKFAVGFGPVVARVQGEEVEYTVRAIPIGGFVTFPDAQNGEDSDRYDPDDPDLLRNRPIWDRAVVVSAGVVANAIFAYALLLTQVSSVGFLRQEMMPGAVVPELQENSAAARGGLRPGDKVIEVGGTPLDEGGRGVRELVQLVKISPGKELQLLVDREGERLPLTIIPDDVRGMGRIGVQLTSNANSKRLIAHDPGEAFKMAGQEWLKLLDTVVGGLVQLFSNFSGAAKQVSGPLAIVSVGAEVARTDISGLYQFAAIVNLNLAVVNLLPLPALDGGYLFLMLIEALRGGKKIPKEVEQAVMTSGLLLLTSLSIWLLIRDAIGLTIK